MGMKGKRNEEKKKCHMTRFVFIFLLIKTKHNKHCQAREILKNDKPIQVLKTAKYKTRKALKSNTEHKCCLIYHPPTFPPP